MALFGYRLPNGSFSVAIKDVQKKGKINLQKQMLQERPVRLHIDQYIKMFKYFAITLEVFDVVW
jgi:hypothetical protein